GGCCLLFSRTRSAPRNSTRFAAPYPARGIPCERFKLSLAASPCITRGRGGRLGLTPWKTCTSYPLPAFLAHAAVGHLPPVHTGPGAVNVTLFSDVLAAARHGAKVPLPDSCTANSRVNTILG